MKYEVKIKLNVEQIRADFPILQRKIRGKPLVYLDSAATSQKPSQVIEAMSDYYGNTNANVHRGVHKLSTEATHEYEQAHEKTSGLINADFEEIIFTKNTTESINLVANSFTNKLKKDDEILLTQMEHHSNLVPWQQLAMRTGAKLKFIKVIPEGVLSDNYSELITEKTKIVAVTHVSNMLGTINPVKEIVKSAKEKGAVTVIDAAQSVPHMAVDVKQLDCDFLAFSGHKMLGPTGIGVLYGRRELLENMEPLLYGGDMIREVRFEGASWNDLPWKFEAGTPPIAEAVGLGAAIDYLKAAGLENIENHEAELTKYCLDKLRNVEGLEIYGPQKRAGVISFNLKGIHAHDAASILDDDGIAVRAGHHCAMPLTKLMGITSSIRASFYLYNTKQEVDYLIDSLERVKKVFSK